MDERRHPAIAAGRPSQRAAIPAALLAALLGACDLGTGPGRDGLELERFAPPPAYRAWWTETEACSGLDGDFERVRFYEVKAPVSGGGSQFPCGDDGAVCSGVWQAPHDIYLAPSLLGFERLVKHEMLHDLLDARGHPRVFDACGLRMPGSSYRDVAPESR